MSQGSTPPWDSREGGDGPGGEVYEWYQRGMELLSSGSPQAASQLLERAADAEPDSRSIREGLARAQYDSRRYADAADNFRRIVDVRPDDDYAHFGLGLSLTRLGEFQRAIEYLAIAAAMRPDVRHYERALRGARATLRARAERDGDTR